MNKSLVFSFFILANLFSAVSFGRSVSNHPYGLIVVLIYFVIQRNIKFGLAKPFRSIALFITIYLTLSSLVLFINPSLETTAIENILLCISYLSYIVFMIQFSLNEIVVGTMIGFAPIALYSLFIELPLYFFNRSLLFSFREALGLRLSYVQPPLAFFMEGSHAPAAYIFLIQCLSIFAMLRKKLANHITNSFIFTCVLVLELTLALTHISGLQFFSFWLPLLLFIGSIQLRKYISKEATLFGNFKKINKAILSSFLVALLASPIWFSYIKQKIGLTYDLDHSSASRFLAFITGIYDAGHNLLMPIGIAQYSYTRIESLTNILNNELFRSLHHTFLYASERAFINSDSAIYSLVGYFFSECGILAFLFFTPFITNFFKTIRICYMYNRRSDQPIVLQLALICGLGAPSMYLFNMSLGYPRILPYALVSLFVSWKFGKYLTNNFSLSPKFNRLIETSKITDT